MEKIFLYKKLFKEEKFDELEKLIDNDLKEENIIEIKFNFTFEKYSFGKNQCVYIIRCIDNKNDNRTLSNSSEEDNIMNDTHNQIRRRLEKFRKNYEILKEEKEIFNENIINLPKLIENEKYKKLINESHNDILILSKIHGKHHFKVTEDENSSQSSLSGYNSDLSKMSRIQEIRRNLMNKTPNSKTIFYIKILPIIWLFISILFSIIYLLFFNKIKNEVVDAGNYSSNLFNAQLSLTQILIILIETYFLYNYHNENKSSISNQNQMNVTEYFTLRKNEGLTMIDKSVELILYLIKNSKIYFSNSYDIWKKTTVQFFVDTPFIYNESFPFIPIDVLMDIKNLFMLKYFSLNQNTNLNDDMELEILYSKFSAIEGGYGIAIPKIFSINSKITHNFIEFNNSRKKYFKIIMVIYSLLSFIVWAFYNYYIFIIFLSMGDGFEKITKISQEKIDDCVKRIEIFKNFYKKKFEIYIQNKDIKSNIKTQIMLNLEKKQTQPDLFLTKKGSTMNFLNKKFELNSKKSIQSNNTFNNNNQNENMNIKNNNYIENVNNNNINTDNTENNQNSINKSYIDFSLNLSSSNEFLEPKKTEKLKNFFGVFVFHLIFFLISIILLILIYYFSNRFINDNTYLFWSRVYLIENFLFTAGSLLYMQCQIINCNSTGEIDRTNIINETLEVILFETLPKFPKLSNFYYKEYLIDACAAMYGFNNDNYSNCLSNVYYIQFTNNTYSIQKIILSNIDVLLYEKTINDAKNQSSISLFISNEFRYVIVLFRNFYIYCVDNLNTILEKSTSGKAENESINILICITIFIFLIGMVVICVQFFFVKSLSQKFTVSRSFVIIIPSFYIMKTQDLDNWLEKADSK